jgi:uncharacterized linocin/CFP29 family protein
MNSAIADIGWTEEQWNRICSTVTEEAQKARVAAQLLPVSGPEDASTVAVPKFTLRHEENLETPNVRNPEYTGPIQPPYEANKKPPKRDWYGVDPPERLAVDSYPTLWLTRISVNVFLHSHEIADPELSAALVMFRRAANHIARLEDIVIFNGRPGDDQVPLGEKLLDRIPSVYHVKGRGPVAGIFVPLEGQPDGRSREEVPKTPVPIEDKTGGPKLVRAIVNAIDKLEEKAQLGPYACVLSHTLFELACSPTDNLVLPRDRILPFLQGPLVRTSTILPGWGAVIALSGNPLEIVVASDIDVRFLQTTLEPRFVFRVSERIALRIKEDSAIAILHPPMREANKKEV